MNENEFQLQCDYRLQVRRWTDALTQTPDAATDLKLQIAFELQLEQLLAEAKTKLSLAGFTALKKWTRRENVRSSAAITKEHKFEKLFPQELSTRERAATVLRTFLADGNRPASECIAHLESAGLAMSNAGHLRARRRAGVVTVQKDDGWWWGLLSRPVEIIESCDEGLRLVESGLELIEEDGCGHVGWGDARG